MPLNRYSRWDGTQKIDLAADDLMAAMADDLLHDGDPWRAMRRLMQQGARKPEGGRMPGLKDLLEKLRRQKQERMQRYDLGSSLDDIKKKLEDVIKTQGAGSDWTRCRPIWAASCANCNSTTSSIPRPSASSRSC